MEVSWVVLLEFNWWRLLGRVDSISTKNLQSFFDLFLIFIIENYGLTFLFFFLIDLDLDSSLWHKGKKGYFGSNFDNFVGIFAQRKVEHAGKDVCSWLNKFNMDGVLEVKVKRSGNSLQTAPEGFSGVFNDVIMREGWKELLDLIIEHILEDVNGQFNAFFIWLFRVGLEKFIEHF